MAVVTLTTRTGVEAPKCVLDCVTTTFPQVPAPCTQDDLSLKLTKLFSMGVGRFVGTMELMNIQTFLQCVS